jgi:hypothetical protein
MSCEKYSGWLTDAALGELRAERDLLAHAMECEACRKALAHARAVRELVDRSVESLVAGEPSPQFATNLRRRIAQGYQPLRLPWAAWAPVVAGALALAVLLAIMVARVPRHSVANPSSASNLKSSPSLSESVTASAASPKNVERTTSGRDTNPSIRTRSTAAVSPEIIVPNGQLAAVAQLSAAINSGRVDGNRLLAAQQESEKPLQVKLIEISPLDSLAPSDTAESSE